MQFNKMVIYSPKIIFMSWLLPRWKVQLAIVAQQRCYHLSEEERQDQGQQGPMLLTSSAM